MLKVSLPDEFDMVVCSPPYANSFDYTDVYNLQLWMLGYLGGRDANRDLRCSTLPSHVQIIREFREPPAGSKKLDSLVQELDDVREQLWSPHLADMIGAYFADMVDVMDACRVRMPIERGRATLVVGDSMYKGVLVPVADILAELAVSRGWRERDVRPARVMRTSAQQGGAFELKESVLTFIRTE